MAKFVPYLAREAIERNAEALLAEFAHARDIVIEPPIPIEDIMEKHLKLGIEFDNTHRLFGIPRQRSLVLALPPRSWARYFSLKSPLSLTNVSTPNSVRAQLVVEPLSLQILAHEGDGHSRLSPLPLSLEQPHRGSPIRKIIRPIRHLPVKSGAWVLIEWQANWYNGPAL